MIVRWDSAKAMRAEMRRRIGEGRRLVIACGSRTAAVGIRDSVAKWRPQTTVQLYHGESDETVRSRDFADVNAQWTAQVVVFTSTCTVGVSYTVQDGGFDSVFLLVGPGGGYGPTALEYAQMTGRARHLHSREVHLVAPPSVDLLPRENASELVAAYVTEKYERHRGDRLLFARRASHDGGLTLTDGQPTLLMTAEAWRAVISRRTDVLPALLRILVDEDRGTWRWAVEQESPGPILSSQEPPEKSVLKRVAKFINESSTKEIERRVADARLLAARSGRREEDICLQDAWSRLRHLREESWRTDDPADQVARLEFIKAHFVAIVLAAVRLGTISESAAHSICPDIRRLVCPLDARNDAAPAGEEDDGADAAVSVQLSKRRKLAGKGKGKGKAGSRRATLDEIYGAVDRVAANLGLDSPTDGRAWFIDDADDKVFEDLEWCIAYEAVNRNPTPESAMWRIKAVWKILYGHDCVSERSMRTVAGGGGRREWHHHCVPFACGSKTEPVTVASVAASVFKRGTD